MTADQLTRDQGYRLWRRLPNGVEVWRQGWEQSQVRSFRAFTASGRRVGSWSTYDGPGGQPSGEVCGDYSMVQGDRAPCRELSAWLDALVDGVPSPA